MIDDPDLNIAMLQASGPLVTAAHAIGGPLPAVFSDEFITAPITVRQAVLVVVGISRVRLGDPVKALLKATASEIHGGDTEYWRRFASNHVPFAEMDKRRGPRLPVRCDGCHARLDGAA